MSVDLAMAASVGDVDVVHSHTWDANFRGHLAKLLYGLPHVVTVHSLEPLRPWKSSQLGAGYEISCFCERVAWSPPTPLSWCPRRWRATCAAAIRA
jgi:starch synthase